MNCHPVPIQWASTRKRARKTFDYIITRSRHGSPRLCRGGSCAIMWACKIPRGVYPPGRPKSDVWRTATTFGEVFRKLAEQERESDRRGHMMPDHVHVLIAIPAKFAMSQLVGLSSGRVRSIRHGYRESGRENSVGQHFLGLAGIVYQRRAGTKPWNHAQEDQRVDQMNLWR